MSVTFPLDLSGNNPTNLIGVATQPELHSTDNVLGGHRIIVPNFAPFFVDNFSLKHTINNVVTDLTEDVEFSFALPYITGTRTTGKIMYGAILINTNNLNGILSLQYQTIGGDQVVDRITVLNYLVEKAYNPRITVWDIITDVPNALPPTPHYQDYDQFFGQEEVVGKLNDIKDAILQNSINTRNELTDFISSFVTGNLNYVNKNGDTMIGPLILNSNPVQPLEAVTKQYVDAIINLSIFNNISDKVTKTGDTMTGFLTLNAAPINDLHASTKKYVDDNVVTINTAITSLQTTVTALNLDPVTKAYVDSQDATKLSLSGGVMTGNISLANNPTQSSHPVTLNYLQQVLTPLLGDPVTRTYVDTQIYELRQILDEINAKIDMNRTKLS